MSGTTSLVTRKVPVTFTAKALFQVARSVFTNGALGASPALLTRISMEPNALRADAMPARTLASSVTSKSARICVGAWAERGLHRGQRLTAPACEAHPRAGFGTGNRNCGADARPRAGNEDVPILERLVRHDDATLRRATGRRRRAPGSFRTAIWRTDIASAKRSISSRSWPPRARSRRRRRDADARSRIDRRGRRR